MGVGSGRRFSRLGLRAVRGVHDWDCGRFATGLRRAGWMAGAEAGAVYNRLLIVSREYNVQRYRI
jgi:hypothetical protein